MTTQIRIATAADAAGIAQVNVTSWRESFAGLLSPAFLATLSVEQIAQNLRHGLERGLVVHVAEIGGQIVGFSHARVAPEGAPRELELRLLYVLAAHHGAGLGQALLDAAIGQAPAFLWTAAENPRALAFYRRNGFRPDGLRQEPRWEDLAEIRMVR